MNRNYAFYFIVLLMVISVYLAPRVLGLRSACGGYCQSDNDCWDRNYCPRCHYDPVKVTYFCGR
ncbi:hypothetical protein P3S67_010318 [Capsicum chacoense]